MGKEIVLVAGINYAQYAAENTEMTNWTLKKTNPGPWRRYCEQWAKNSLIQDPKLKVTLFDIFNGTREDVTLDSKSNLQFNIELSLGELKIPDHYRRLDYSSGSAVLVPLTDKLRGTPYFNTGYFTAVGEMDSGPVSLAAYVDHFLGSNPKAPKEVSISIVDVYDYLIGDVAAKRPNTVTELHFFSHGWEGGPILANTYDFKTGKDRDPLDKDARREKDFDPVNLSLTKFKKAFHPSAFCFVWGCIAWKFMKRLILHTIRQKKKIRDQKLKALQFKWHEDWGVDQSQFHSELGGRAGVSDKMSVIDVRELVKAKLDATYMKKLAVASGTKVFGGLPGTYSDYDKKGKISDRFLHIPMDKKFGDVHSYIDILEFYKKILGVQFDPSQGSSPDYGRGFGIFEP